MRTFVVNFPIPILPWSQAADKKTKGQKKAEFSFAPNPADGS
jgi:hypothetical protein